MTPELLAAIYAITQEARPDIRLFASIGLACDLARGEDIGYAVSEAQTCLVECDPQASGVRCIQDAQGAVVGVDPGPEFCDEGSIDFLSEVVMLPDARARFVALEALIATLLSSPDSDLVRLEEASRRAVAAVGKSAFH